MLIIFSISLLLGSFLNVCIYRIPRGESIGYPPSHCPKCGANLKAVDLIPLLSYALNKGKCRYCGDRISLQYPLVELFNGIIYLLLYMKYGLSIIFIKYAILSSLLLVISVIDYQQQIIPDKLIIFGFIVGLSFITLYNFRGYFLNGIIGLFIGGGIFLLIAIASKGAMGGGDIKLMAVIGLWLGWKYILLITLMSFIIGAVASIILLALKIKKRKDYIPFGPFISISAYIVILYGNEILQWYINSFL